MPEEMKFPTHYISELSVKTLFYPCAAEDWKSIVPLFLPHINKFWFVDVCYSPESIKKSKSHIDSCVPAGETSIKEVQFPLEEGEADLKYNGQQPFVVTQQYTHSDSGTHFEVNWYMRRGPSALRSLEEPIGVFFYRGDSDEGSKSRWLVDTGSYGQFGDVIKRLVSGGLVITDGSNPSYRKHPYKALSQFHTRAYHEPSEAALSATTFQDGHGNSFECVGYVDQPANAGNGPILAWRITKIG